ncbi:hypothetical protein FN846DRAFT_348065, partial [Sphaerosporella brunnea]
CSSDCKFLICKVIYKESYLQPLQHQKSSQPALPTAPTQPPLQIPLQPANTQSPRSTHLLQFRYSKLGQLNLFTRLPKAPFQVRSLPGQILPQPFQKVMPQPRHRQPSCTERALKLRDAMARQRRDRIRLGGCERWTNACDGRVITCGETGGDRYRRGRGGDLERIHETRCIREVESVDKAKRICGGRWRRRAQMLVLLLLRRRKGLPLRLLGWWIKRCRWEGRKPSSFGNSGDWKRRGVRALSKCKLLLLFRRRTCTFTRHFLESAGAFGGDPMLPEHWGSFDFHEQSELCHYVILVIDETGRGGVLRFLRRGHTRAPMGWWRIKEVLCRGPHDAFCLAINTGGEAEGIYPHLLACGSNQRKR